MNNLCICFANNLYQEEYKSFKQTGWIKDKNVTYSIGGNEFLITNKVVNTFKYDIGFFSSAYWARRDGLYADNNIIALKNSIYVNNLYSKREIIILKNIIKISKKYKYKLKIYLHPYEKRLINKYNIYPPYWDLINLESLSTDISLGSNNFYEPKVAVLLQSSIFYDRWENNLFTLCYQFKKSKNRRN
jgi:hypothetical protein